MSYQPKIALVHDDFIQAGGAERLFATIAEIWPKAPIFTSVADLKVLEILGLSSRKIITSFIQSLPAKKKLYRAYFPLYPLAFESFNFDEYDVVLSSTTRFAKGVITKPLTCHIAYVNNPPRFLWDTKAYFGEENVPTLARLVLIPFISWLRLWDQTAATRVDFWLANSKNVAQRIKKRYLADAQIIYPGVDLSRFKPTAKSEDFFLIVSRLAAWKKIEIAIEAFNTLKLPLKIVGEGPQKSKLQRMAKKNIQFLGDFSDLEVAALFQKCRALVVTQEEDFGLTILEAHASGKPVISYREGGAGELIEEGKTGLFFFPQTSQALIEAIENFGKQKFDSQACLDNANQFSKGRFQQRLKEFVEETQRKYRISLI